MFLTIGTVYCVWPRVRCRVLLRTLSSTYTDVALPAARLARWKKTTVRLVCQRPSSNFPYFRTPLANFLLSRPNSVKQLHCCLQLNVRVHSSKVDLAAAGVHPVGMISSHASVPASSFLFYIFYELILIR